MNLDSIVSLAITGVLLGSTASAQFSVSGPGSTIPASGTGGGGIWTTTLPTTPGASVVSVPVQVTSIGSVEIMGLNHTYMGDLQLVLTDPAGVGHNLFVRPGKDYNGSNFGNSGDFLFGDYTIAETGGLNFPQDTTFVDLNPGTYNQSFTTGTTVWPNGQSNIQNTPMGQIQGPAGNWTLTWYDWAGGDSGGFTGWRLNGNGGTISGQPFCFGDGTGAPCPCQQLGGVGEGCMTTSGQGAVLSGSGIPLISSDTFVLSVSGAPANKPGVIFQGSTQLGNPFGDGILCTIAQFQNGVMWTDATGSVTQTGFAANASVGATLNYQFWFRDPANPCGAGNNYSNGWEATWQ